METLNLIPDTAKKILGEKRKYEFFSSVFLIIFVIVTTLTIPLLAGNIILQNTFIESVESSNQVTRVPEEVSIDIKGINAKLNKIEELQNEYIPWSRLLIVLANHTPESVTLSNIQVSSREMSVLVVAGTALTRDDFLTFKANLEKDSIVESVQSPVSNILRQTDIQFTLNVSLRIEDI